jgi:FkbM family methyltransferase
MSLRRRIAFLPPVEHAVVTARGAACVRERGRFVAGQLLTSRPVRYTLASSGLSAYVRHRSPDVHILIEIEHNRIYEPPAQVADALAKVEGPLRVLDLGGNIGLFATWVLGRHPEARVTSFEPDAHNAKVLRATQRANGFDGRWDLVEAAAGAEDGSVSFSTGDFYNSQVVPDGSGELVRAVDVLPLAAEADFVKIDIEGSEWPILADPRLADVRARAFAMEWHKVGCPAEDARAAAIGALERAGFSVLAEPPDDPRYGTLWAWRD